MDEVWKDIRGYEGRYMISNLGRVKSLPNRDRNSVKILSPYENGIEYKMIDLIKDGHQKHARVHRLVAYAFIDNIYDKPYINHMDGNRRNNAVTNLEWCTQKENVRHAHITGLVPHKISYDDVDMIRMLEGSLSEKCIGALYGISGSYVSKIHRNETMNYSLTGVFV